MKIDRNWENRKAQQFLLDIFGKLGATNPLVIDGRKKMQRILY
jgi:Thioredoxin domain-containing protein